MISFCVLNEHPLWPLFIESLVDQGFTGDQIRHVLEKPWQWTKEFDDFQVQHTNEPRGENHPQKHQKQGENPMIDYTIYLHEELIECDCTLRYTIESDGLIENLRIAVNTVKFSTITGVQEMPLSAASRKVWQQALELWAGYHSKEVEDYIRQNERAAR